MIKVQNNIASREPLPSFLVGLSTESLADLSWTDPQLGVQDAAWLPEVDQTAVLDQDQVYDGTETLTVGDGVVNVVRGIRQLTTEEIRDRWLAENPVPQVISRAQGKAALIGAGLWQVVVEFIAAIPDATERALGEVALNDTQEWHRDSPFLNSAKASLGLTDEQLDELFVTASKIKL